MLRRKMISIFYRGSQAPINFFKHWLVYTNRKERHMDKQIKIALAGNPNCGKTTLFNALTGSNQFVGNWPGVTV